LFNFNVSLPAFPPIKLRILTKLLYNMTTVVNNAGS